MTFNHVLSNEAIECPKGADEELCRLKDFLGNKIYNKLKEIPVPKRTCPEGGMNTFFNILACHRLLCIETGKISVNEQLDIDTLPNSETVRKNGKISLSVRACRTNPHKTQNDRVVRKG